jgi:hypothetical protein
MSDFGILHCNEESVHANPVTKHWALIISILARFLTLPFYAVLVSLCIRQARPGLADAA